MDSDGKTVLILCTGNSCRSQMAEVIWNHLGQGKWRAHSAGSRPAGFVHPNAIRALQEIDLPVDNLTSKSSEPFADQNIDLVVTVCDNARDACPTWPGAGQVLHWPFPDPADAEGADEEQMQVFRAVRDDIWKSIEAWLSEQATAT